MIEALDEISEVPFEVFWDKFMELHPGTYDRYTAEGYWLKMREDNRLLAFGFLSRFGSSHNQPWKHLQHFDLPF
jgi:hypothetical protein